MNDLLNKLANQLSQLRSDYYRDLQVPLTDLEIDVLEHQYGLAIPADLRQLYRWKNGQSAKNRAAFVNNSLFLPLDDSLRIAQENTAMIGYDFDIDNWWHGGWIPVFHNGGGDYICYDAGGLFTGQPGQLIEFWHADNDRNVIAPDLERFLAQLVDYYDKTSPIHFDGYYNLDPLPGYPKSFVVS